MGERIPVLSPEGQFGTVDAADAEAVTRAGGKLLTGAQVKERELREEYDKKSTAEKVTGAVAGLAAGPIVGNALAGSGVIATAPEVQAFDQGQSSAVTLGLDQIGVKAALNAVAGPKAAAEYGKNQLDVAAAHSGYKTAGQTVGIAATALAGGGLGGAAKAIPGLGASALGGVAEAGAAKVLAPLAARGVLGRALATGGELAARGAVEGALYSGANQITEDMLGDKDVVADKVFASMGTGALYGAAGGFAMGAGGSLAASGARSAISAGRGALGRALTRGGEDAAVAAEREPLRLHGEQPTANANPPQSGPRPDIGAGPEAAAAEAAATKPETGITDLRRMLKGEDAGARGVANDLAYDALGATKTAAKKINEKIEGGTKAVGDYVNRRILSTSADDASLLGTIKSGRADEMLPRIQAEVAADGAKIGDIVQASPVRVDANDLIAKAMKTHAEMMSDPTRIAGADAFQRQIGQTFDAFANGGKLVDGHMDLSEMYYARAKMEGVAHEMKRANGAAGDAMKDWLRQVDEHLVTKIDEAARAIGDTGKRDELLGLKREYQLGKAAEKAATEGADRIAGNNTFGIREGIGGMVGLAMGHPIAAIGAAIAGKVARERGSAAGAYLLTKMADMRILSRAVTSADEQIGRSAKGLLAPPKARPLPEPLSTVPLRERAAKVIDHAATAAANPERLATDVANHVDALNSNAPNLASGLGQRMTSAYALL
ncbi:MAG: hypothetical protein V4537_12425, partial [Pseudomonadota bacterium]